MYNLLMVSLKRSLTSLRGRCLCLPCKWNPPGGFDITGFVYLLYLFIYFFAF